MAVATGKQMSVMYRFTGLKFWEPANPPAPDVSQASCIIGQLFSWDKAYMKKDPIADHYKTEIIKMVRVFFPEWTGESLKHACIGKAKHHRTPYQAGRPPMPEQAEQQALPMPMPMPENVQEAAKAAEAAKKAAEAAEQAYEAAKAAAEAQQAQHEAQEQQQQAEAQQDQPEQSPEGQQEPKQPRNGRETPEEKAERMKRQAERMRQAKAEKAGKKTQQPEENQQADEAEEGQPEEDKTPQQAAKEANGKAEHHEDQTVVKVVKLIKAGITNIYLHGPAGSGKTTIASIVAQVLGLPCTILSCSAGTSASDFLGRRLPTVEPSPVSGAIGIAGIVVLDEITMLDPPVAAVANALLANPIINTTHGAVERKCVIIATSNISLGGGADRMYLGNNQLDAATNDRFIGAAIKVDYNTEYEYKTVEAEVVEYVHNLRKVIDQHKLRRIASTRSIVNGHRMYNAGIKSWKEDLVETWTPEERAKINF